MPLPGNATLSLQGHSRPGDTVHSKPKQAMIVRMSAETLEALESFPQQPQMDFEFGDNPGIYIGATFFSIRPLKESMPHELYLRASSVAKPMAPLKLYANVTGKFTVERDLAKVQNKVRESTLGAVQQRSARQTILIDAPSDLHAPIGKKRKVTQSSIFVKPVQHADRTRTSVLSSSSTFPPPPISAQTTTREGLLPVRKHLVHCLAVAEHTTEEILRIVGGSEIEPSLRRDLLGLLDELAEQPVSAKKGMDKSLRPWRLKPNSWLEVRPYEWPKLTDPERKIMARSARLAYTNLKIPESDPSWIHVRYRSPTSTIPGVAHPPSGASSRGSGTPNGRVTGPAAAKADPPKRGITSKEARDKKAKPNAEGSKANPEILMKNESAKATPRVGMRAKEIDDVDEKMGPAIKATGPARRAPGSGFKVAKSTSQDGRSDTFDGPSPSPIPRGRPVDVRRKDREALISSLPAKPTPPVPSLTSHERKSGVGIIPTRTKKVKDVTVAGADSDMDHRREWGQDRQGDVEGSRDRNPERERERDRGRGKDRDRGTENDHKDRERDRLKGKDSGLAVSSKRKKPLRELDETPLRSTAKRRKTEEDGLPVPSSSQDSGARDLSFPRKSDLLGFHPQRKGTKREMSLPSPNAKRDPSPPPRRCLPSQGKMPIGSVTAQDPTHQGAAKSAKLNGIAKPRRRSPIYTSSEEENEVRRPKRDPPPVPHTTAPTMHSPYAHHYSHPQPRFHPSRSLPADHAALRARYSSSYLEYLTTFHKVVAQRGKIESLLKSGGSGSVGSITDSDGDVELMEADDLVKLSAEHKTLQDELESIQQIFLRPSKAGSTSD